MKCTSPVLSIVLLAASCTDFPKDPRGTLKRVQSEGRFRVGLVEPLKQGGRRPEISALLGRLSAATSARPAVTTGETEPLLTRLEEGELDLVIGHFEKKSPWTSRVDFGPALRTEKQGKAEIRLAPAMRNGENAWIAVVEREARNVAQHVE